MAEETGQERTEKPTARRLREAREKGDLPRSRDLDGALIVLVEVGLLILAGNIMFDEMQQFLKGALTFDRDTLDSGPSPEVRLGTLLIEGLWTMRWLLLISFVVALLVPAINGGFSFSSRAFSPNFGRLNPLNGLKRMFGARSWIELLRTLLKFLAIGAVLVAAFWAQLPAMLAIAAEDVEPMMAGGASLALNVLLAVSLAVLVLAALDVPYQRWSYTRRHRMTKQQVKEEMKNIEGRPEVKQAIRRRQREISRRRMLDNVRNADVIITNPTEFAVAIVYDEASMSVPMLVAKGRGELARSIRERAESAQIPRVEAPLLARALYYTVEVDGPIPEGLYRAVANVLAYVFQLSALRADLQQPELSIPDIPPEFRFDEAGRGIEGEREVPP